MYSCRRLAGVSQLQVKLFSGCDKATSVSTMWRSFDISRVCTCKRHPGFLQVPLLGVLGYTLVALTLLLASSHWTTARIVTRGNATALSWRLHSLEGEAAFWGGNSPVFAPASSKSPTPPSELLSESFFDTPGGFPPIFFFLRSCTALPFFLPHLVCCDRGCVWPGAVFNPLLSSSQRQPQR
jgi:hypothetical protein